MSNRRFEMYEYRQILVRMRLGDSDRALAKAGLIGRRKASHLRRQATEQGWLDRAAALPDEASLAQVLRPVTTAEEAPVSASSVEPYRAQVQRWWEAGIQASTIHQTLVREYGFSGSYYAVNRFVKRLAGSQPKATVHLSFAPGEAAQVDFGRGPDIIDVETGEVIRSWFFVMTLCWSRHQYAELVRDQTVATWLSCHRRAFEWFGGVPQRLIIDNAKCAIIRACHREPTVQRAYGECAEGYGFKIDACPPRQPQKKGRVEAGVKFIKRSFLPLREFRTLREANQHLQSWVLSVGNRRHGSTHAQPLRQFTEVEKNVLTPLPRVAPEQAVWAQPKVHRDGHVQFENNLYSVPFRLIGQRLWLRATAALVQLFDEQPLLVASHTRLRGTRQRATLDDHLPPEALAYQLQGPQWCQRQAEVIGPQCQVLIERLFADRVMDNLRAAQGVIRLAKRYGAERLEAACERALSFDNARYRTVKTILDKGLDQHPPRESAFDQLAESYTGGGRFCRPSHSLLSH
jgi:transposase